MAINLKEYLQNKECKGFNARPHYFQDGDFVTYFSKDALAYEQRVNELITLYRTPDANELVGCKIKGVRRIMSTLATFAVIVSDGKAFNLGMLFLGATILEPTQRDEYKEVLQQYAPVPLDYTELPLAQAA